MASSFETGAIVLLFVAAVVAMLTRRLRLPYSVGLVAAGMVLALVPFSPQVNLTKELIFAALLPPLIFEAALYLHPNELRRDLPLILVLASLGVVLSAGVTAAGMHALVHWPWQAGLVFGALIAATDPVSVIASFREAGVTGRLRLLLEAESLFNDGAAAVAFAIAVTFAAGGHLTAAGTLSSVLTLAGGGILCGALTAGVLLLLSGRTEDHLVVLTFTTVAAYGSFLLAEHFQVSGVLATLTAGLLMGNTRELGTTISRRSKEALEAFWEYAAFAANSLVFLLIGMHETRQSFAVEVLPAAAAIFLVILSRGVAIYPICLLFSRSALRVPLRQQHVLFWGGLRGALALALALGLPPEVPMREDIIAISFAVVAFSIFVQGLSITPFLRKMGEIPRANLGASPPASTT
jgi:monovalent cation:H+ antiporter, CPA1 family